MFWIYCLIIFLVLCTALTLIVRLRGGGTIRGGTGVDNHNALQQGEAYLNARRGQGHGPGSGGSFN